MALPESVLALDAAGRLDRELTALISYLDDPSCVFARDARTAFLTRSMETVVATARLLHRHVLDALAYRAESSIENHERAIRARANVIMRALYILKGCEREIPPPAFAGRFRDVHDVSTFLADNVAHIYVRWCEQREGSRKLDGAAQQAVRYAAVDDAEIAFAHLGRDSALATWLRVGAESENEAVCTACRDVAATVGLALPQPKNDRMHDVPAPRVEQAS